jgi:exodeoxyribonuclease X
VAPTEGGAVMSGPLFLVLDCETTGTDHAVDRVVELGAVLTSETETLAYASTLVNPGIPIRPDASAVHHLVDENVANAPALERAVEDVVAVVMQGQDRFEVDAYVAHNAPFDRGFLGEHFSAAPWIDTYRAAKRYLPDLPGHSNQFLRYGLGLPVKHQSEILDPAMSPHRALGDAIVTAALLRFLLAGPAGEDYRRLGMRDFAAHVDSPLLLTTVGFGKHQGKPWAEVPADYLAWMLRQNPGFDYDTEFTARYYMQR